MRDVLLVLRCRLLLVSDNSFLLWCCWFGLDKVCVSCVGWWLLLERLWYYGFWIMFVSVGDIFFVLLVFWWCYWCYSCGFYVCLWLCLGWLLWDGCLVVGYVWLWIVFCVELRRCGWYFGNWVFFFWFDWRLVIVVLWCGGNVCGWYFWWVWICNFW